MATDAQLTRQASKTGHIAPTRNEVHEMRGKLDILLYKAALGNGKCFEGKEWGLIEYCIMAKRFEHQGKSPSAYHAVSTGICLSHRHGFGISMIGIRSVLFVYKS
uniref:Uncharacterized protein n=1 Tax=Quercus lobata TaxID=97700 RepID=A0A7N2M9Y3_QUELO